MKKLLTRKAFSLIELSIVILIIGLLIAGVTQSSRMIAQMKLSTARSLTRSSPAVSIKDLAAWYDSVSDESFTNSEEEDGLTVTNWYDINPQSTIKNNMSPATSKAVYTSSAINGLPALYFDESNNNGYTNSTLVINDEMTIFAVVTREESGTTFKRIIHFGTYFYFGIATGTSRQLAVFYGDGTAWNHTGGFGTDAVLGLSQAYVLSSTQTSAGLNTGYVNGVSVGNPAVTPETKGKSTGLKISNSGAQSWKGYIAEIIIFNRALSNSDRKEVEQYLGKKWGVKVS